jgi:hypothetical protein
MTTESQASLDEELGRLRQHIGEAEFAKLEYERKVEEHRKRREWTVLAIDELVVAFVLVYVGPINGLGNGANDYLDACVKHDEARKADLKRKICGLRVTLQAKIEQLYEGTAPNVQRRTFETCR